VTKNPSTTFYFNDWENDEKLRVCTLAAQGLWMRLLCIAARSPEPGIVQIGTLDMSPPHGLTLIASAVGQPLDVINPWIDELLTSGAASRDRQGRIYCRRMVRAAKLSLARSEAGKSRVRYGLRGENGQFLSDGNTERISDETSKRPSKPSSKPPASSRLQDSESSSHGITESAAARATADPDGPPRTRQYPDSAKWAERLAAFKPWLGERPWKPEWGPTPDSSGTPNPLIPAQMLTAWRVLYAGKMGQQRSTA